MGHELNAAVFVPNDKIDLNPNPRRSCHLAEIIVRLSCILANPTVADGLLPTKRAFDLASDICTQIFYFARHGCLKWAILVFVSSLIGLWADSVWTACSTAT
jgi:hypothetical protein